MKALLSIVLSAVFALVLISISFADECFTNHDCPDVDMNCVRGVCKHSMWSKGKAKKNDNSETRRLESENSSLENENRRLEMEIHQYEADKATARQKELMKKYGPGAY
jgi:hypothetical protein